MPIRRVRRAVIGRPWSTALAKNADSISNSSIQLALLQPIVGSNEFDLASVVLKFFFVIERDNRSLG